MKGTVATTWMPQSKGWLRMLLGRVALVLAIILLAVTLGRDVTRVMSTAPTLPSLFAGFFPTVIVASLLSLAILYSRFQGRLLPSLGLPRQSPRLISAVLLLFLGAGALLSLMVAVAIGNWGFNLAVPILIALIALVAVFWLSLYRVVDALALYFAIWPVLAIIRVSLALQRDSGLVPSVLVVPIRVSTDTLGTSPMQVADSVWGQLALVTLASRR